MGGFISLLLAADPTLKSSIAGLLLVAPAVNFSSVLYKSICSQLPKEVIEHLEAGGLYKYENEFGSRTIRKSFFDSAAELEFKGEIHVDVPVTILHGVKDETVPFKDSLQIIENITSKDVELTYVKESTHRFQDPSSLKLLKDAVLKMVEKTKRTDTDR
ncbi:mycophenolic acid acyl-glucuronide esterase, mitochondrial-like [Eurytemora carolleeae]|uniref:mycophenolic acid acyl-glucuronide esterase, mitochondrial-like n=1 Tax=Eurytemora carolleeae TaxID=1294199 RepID=UPI000C758DC7|nr:mycophenolic acid acyl-glucuronide esterase, mitochondrial-like [Eurytemora carolleeae]|eukprot:XP_023342925.1 mycophenolic acid acyl-glucuronide esterase, mitochondrial-like [Eurytemora affinis]